ncbi:MAG: hypothetical protein Q9226_007444, partial [Calogaya cf. arnoldii]
IPLPFPSLSTPKYITPKIQFRPRQPNFIDSPNRHEKITSLHRPRIRSWNFKAESSETITLQRPRFIPLPSSNTVVKDRDMVEAWVTEFVEKPLEETIDLFGVLKGLVEEIVAF